MCPLCNEKFFTSYGLGSHLDSVHGSQAKMMMALPCRPCKSQFQGLDKLVDHMWLAHQHSGCGSDSQCAGGIVIPDENKSDNAKKASTSCKGSSGMFASMSEVLPVVDFSCEKFSFVAQVLSERSPSRKTQKSTAYLTPSRALIGGSDVKRQTFPCTVCEQAFDSRAHCVEHALQCHDTSTVMSEFSRVSNTSDPRDSIISEEEFFLVMGLKVSANRTAAPISSSPRVAVANKCTVVDANRNVVKTEILQSPVQNGPGTPVLFGHLIALAGSMSQILPGTMPILRLPPHLSLLTKSNHPSFSLTSAAPLESQLVVAGPRGLQALPGIMTSASPTVIPSTAMSCIGLMRKRNEMVTLEPANTNVMNLSASSSTAEKSSNDDSCERTDGSEKDSSSNGGLYRCSVCDDSSFISYRAYRGESPF